MRMRDFTLERYKELCLALLDSGYAPLTVYSYLILSWRAKRIIIISVANNLHFFFELIFPI